MSNAGWELSSGEIKKKDVSSDELWKIFNRIFSTKSKKTTSYKFALIRAILENLYNANDDLTISFDRLSESFARLYWNLVIKHGYSQGKNAATDKLLHTIKEKLYIPNQMFYDSLSDIVKLKIKEEIEKKVLKRYVLGALYADTEGSVYQFDKKSSLFQLNQPAYQFMLKFQEILFRLNNYELTKFIQANNPLHTSENIIYNIENITKRENLSRYKDILREYTQLKCFYTEQDLNRNNIEIAVDHFIPWSFIHSDNLWNFVLTTNTLNSKKGAKLPSKLYVEKLIERNHQLKNIKERIIQNEMCGYNKQKLIQLHSYAELNGFVVGWEP